jgi:hypothetical protein
MTQDKPIRMTGKEYYELLQKTRREVLEEVIKIINGPWTIASSQREIDLLSDIQYLITQKLMKMIAADQGQGQTTQAGPVEERKG